MSKRFFHCCGISLHLLITLFAPLPAQESGSQEEAEDYESFVKDHEGFQLNLNRAETASLLELPGLTPDLAARIEASRPYRRLDDLRLVSGITPDILDQVLPFLTLDEPVRWRGKVTTRVSRPAQHPNALDHLRLTQRAEFQLANRVSGFVLIDRDPQEPNWTDYATAHLTIDHSTGQVTLGDLRPEIGQGLLHSSLSRSTSSFSGAKPRAENHVANRSSTEFGAIRGIHVSTRWKGIAFQALYGQVKWDALIGFDGPVEIRRTEEHVSQTARDRKGILSERMATVHLAFGSPRNHLGITAQHLDFSPAAPQGVSRRSLSLNGRKHWHEIAFFGEWATSGGGQALVSGLHWQRNGFRIRGLFRRYGPNFSSLHGAPFAAYGAPPQNEAGVFFGCVYQAGRRTRFELSLDRHNHLVPERFALPDTGLRFRLTARRRVGQSSVLQISRSVRATRYDRPREENRVTWLCAHRALRSTAWVSRTAVSPMENGIAGGLRLQIGRGHRLALWRTHYHVGSYDARIYDFEPDVWGGGTLQTRTGHGKASGLLLGLTAENFHIAVRYSLRKTNGERASSWSLQINSVR
jgi:hypothetical protein